MHCDLVVQRHSKAALFKVSWFPQCLDRDHRMLSVFFLLWPECKRTSKVLLQDITSLLTTSQSLGVKFHAYWVSTTEANLCRIRLVHSLSGGTTTSGAGRSSFSGASGTGASATSARTRGGGTGGTPGCPMVPHLDESMLEKYENNPSSHIFSQFSEGHHWMHLMDESRSNNPGERWT
jgi:hypothetical protein